MVNLASGGIGLNNEALLATLGLGLGPAAVGAGRHKKKYILPDGSVVTDPNEAYAELERQLRARAAELDAPSEPGKRSPRKKRKRSRSIHPRKPPKLLAALPLPDLIERLPEAERATIDLELVDLVARVAKRRRDDEETIILLI